MRSELKKGGRAPLKPTANMHPNCCDQLKWLSANFGSGQLVCARVHLLHVAVLNVPAVSDVLGKGEGNRTSTTAYPLGLPCSFFFL